MLSAWLPEQAARPHGNREGNTAIRLARPRNFLFKAGQFVDLILLGDPPDRANGLRHTFSIASSPSAEEIVVATRMRDTPFKRALAVLPLGTDLRIEGPMGSFNLHKQHSQAGCLIGGRDRDRALREYAFLRRRGAAAPSDCFVFLEPPSWGRHGPWGV